MSKDKYPSIFSPQMESFVFIILQIFFVTRAVLKIWEYPRIFLSFIWGILAHVTRLDQSRASENICVIYRNCGSRQQRKNQNSRCSAYRMGGKMFTYSFVSTHLKEVIVVYLM